MTSKWKMVSFRATRDELDMLKRLMAESGLTRSDLLRALIAQAAVQTPAGEAVPLILDEVA